MDRNTLVVDDDASIVELLSAILAREGYQVSEATSAQQALRMADDRIPDAIVMDWMMPDTDGLALCRLFRGRKETASVPIIIASANDDVRTVWRQAGADACLLKPFNTECVVDCVRGLLAGSRRQALKHNHRQQGVQSTD